MLILLTPSKTMDFQSPAPDYVQLEEPLFAQQSQLIRQLLGGYSEQQLSQLMRTSPTLTRQVAAMYADTETKKAALWTYTGDVYRGFQATTLTSAAAEFAQQRLLIPSAVYGLVRPYDAIRPYRLEMSAKLSVEENENLYSFWQNHLAQYIVQHPKLGGVVCVLSSQEYARAAVALLPTSVRIVTPVFVDTKPDGSVGQVPIYSKMMRGVMARWLVDSGVDTPAALTSFAAHGYAYHHELSAPDTPTFLRRHMSPLRFAQ